MDKNSNASHQDLPIIDHALALKLAGNNTQLAKDILALLIKNLPHDFHQLKIAKEKSDWNELHLQVHKLRGAVAYCGLPQLKQALISLECALKQQDTASIPLHFDSVAQAIEQLLSHPR